MKVPKYVEIVDTTLRDGEQTPGVSFKPEEKLQIAKTLLGQVKVDRLEVGSARVSEGEGLGAQKIFEWAEAKGLLEKVEILGFTDKGKSVDWIRDNGGKVINLLTKGSETHCRGQLRKEPQQHYDDVCKVVDYAGKQGLLVNVYLEDWTGGMRDNFGYVYEFTKQLLEHDVQRIMLADTLGIANPMNLERYLEWMYAAFPEARFDFHGHNDYGLVTANTLCAVKAGINGIHTTVNGLGERTGNQSLCQAAAIIHDMTERRTKLRENRLDYVARMVQTLSGKRIAANTPIVGADVFTQTCGVHADGDKKGNLYANPLLPERFSRKRTYALGKLSGKASIDKNLETMGMELNPEVRDRVLQEVIRLGDKKKKITPEDLPFIIADILKTPQHLQVRVVEYDITTASGAMPTASVKLQYKGKDYEGKAKGDGGYDAFVKAVKKAVRPLKLKAPRLMDYEVRIPPGGMSDALVETTITWDTGGEMPLVTIGVDSDQTVAAIEATEKMLNHILS